MHESALILLQTVPTHIQMDDIQRKLISQVDGVLAVHEFHVWQLAGDRIIASAHIRSEWLTIILLSFTQMIVNDLLRLQSRFDALTIEIVTDAVIYQIT